MKTALTTSLVLVPLLTLWGCGEPEPAARPDPTASAPTYWGDVAPIFTNKCVKCHQAGGIAPFRLDRYEDARLHAGQAAAATRTGLMPPYLVTHDGSCGQFKDDETLSAAEISTIGRWASGGQKEGVRVALAPAPIAGLGEAREWKTPTIIPVAEGGELAEFDEYRCFELDSGLDRRTFITGYDVIPGNPALVHHLVAFLVDPSQKTASGQSNREVMTALDRLDPERPGWSCFGAAGEGVEPEAVPAVWAPGQGATIYPGGIGVEHRPEHKLVVQLHYNLAGHGSHGGHAAVAPTAGMSDSTTLRLRHSDMVERRAMFTTGDGFLGTLFEGQPASLPAGQKNVSYTWSMTGAELGLPPEIPYVDLIGVMPHMHERGLRKRMRLGPDGGELACVANVDRWDFNWQKFYYYETPLRLGGKSRLEVTCEYDTSADTAPVLPGWGTRNEMCAAIMILALPPGM